MEAFGIRSRNSRFSLAPFLTLCTSTVRASVIAASKPFHSIHLCVICPTIIWPFPPAPAICVPSPDHRRLYRLPVRVFSTANDHLGWRQDQNNTQLLMFTGLLILVRATGNHKSNLPMISPAIIPLTEQIALLEDVSPGSKQKTWTLRERQFLRQFERGIKVRTVVLSIKRVTVCTKHSFRTLTAVL